MCNVRLVIVFFFYVKQVIRRNDESNPIGLHFTGSGQSFWSVINSFQLCNEQQFLAVYFFGYAQW